MFENTFNLCKSLIISFANRPYFENEWLNKTWLTEKNPTNIYLFKVNERNTRKRCEICLKLIIETLERSFEKVNVSWEQTNKYTLKLENRTSKISRRTTWCHLSAEYFPLVIKGAIKLVAMLFIFQIYVKNKINHTLKLTENSLIQLNSNKT